MKTFGQVMVLIQKVVNDFDGIVSLKDADRKYFYVNEPWLTITQFEKSQVTGKTDDELLPADIARFTRKTDLEACEKGIPIQYINKVLLNNREITYIAIKWVVYYTAKDPFCYCTIAHLQKDKEKVIALQKKICSILDTEVFEKTDYTTSPPAVPPVTDVPASNNQ